MNRKLKTAIFGTLLAGSLMMTAVPAMARDWRDQDRYNHSYYDHDRYDHSYYRGRNDRNNGDWYDPEWGSLHGSRSDYEALQQARQQALYDASHHASRKKIAEDDAVVDEIVNRMRYGR